MDKYIIDIPKDFSVLLKIEGDRTNIYIDTPKIGDGRLRELDILEEYKRIATLRHGDIIDLDTIRDIIKNKDIAPDIIRRLRLVNFIKKC